MVRFCRDAEQGTNMTFDRFPLDETGNNYFLCELGFGLLTSLRARELLPIQDKILYAVLPSGTPNVRIRDYDCGGISWRLPAFEATLALLECGTPHHNDCWILFENRFAKRGDRCLEKDKPRILYYRDEVYYAVSLNESLTAITSVFKSAMTALRTTFFICSAHSVFRPPGDLNADDIDMIVKQCVACVITAYDGEGFIFWTKSA
jgi:hypothetical protein